MIICRISALKKGSVENPKCSQVKTIDLSFFHLTTDYYRYPIRQSGYWFGFVGRSATKRNELYFLYPSLDSITLSMTIWIAGVVMADNDTGKYWLDVKVETHLIGVWAITYRMNLHLPLVSDPIFD